jgi:hypothetical protein
MSIAPSRAPFHHHTIIAHLALFWPLCSAEALGVVPAAVYLVAIFLFIPFYFNAHFQFDDEPVSTAFPMSKVWDAICGLARFL